MNDIKSELEREIANYIDGVTGVGRGMAEHMAEEIIDMVVDRWLMRSDGGAFE